MPFDGGNRPAPEVVLIDKMAEVLGPNGEYWGQGVRRYVLFDGYDSYCVLGALDVVGRNKGRFTLEYSRVVNALFETSLSPNGIVAFNDEDDTDFETITRWLGRARMLLIARSLNA